MNNEETDKAKTTKNGLTKTIESLSIQWPVNITILDLSRKNLDNIEENVQFPHNLSELNLSHNNLKEVPRVVLYLKKLNILDLSYNSIVLFDDSPEFCNSIERLDVSNNKLIRPPYWMWSKMPKKLYYLNMSENSNLTNSFQNDYYLEELLTYTSLLTEIDIYNCHLKNDSIKLLSTFTKAKKITLGKSDYNYLSTNYLIELPCEGLDKLCDITSLNVSNTHIYTINSNINIYENLIELNLSENVIHSLPEEFCSLVKLEVCLLSNNRLLYLPEDMNNLTNLRVLCVNNNELCMIPENLYKVNSLRILDLYDNFICEVPDALVNMMSEIDLAQNYYEEPKDVQYIDKKLKLRLNKEPRNDGRKIELIRANSEHTPRTTDDEKYLSCSKNSQNENETRNCESSSENWDSDNDDSWIPHYQSRNTTPKSLYDFHVKQKIEEGNFCPSDLHTESVAAQVLYEKKCNPMETYESEGQFDDCSSDGS